MPDSLLDLPEFQRWFSQAENALESTSVDEKNGFSDKDTAVQAIKASQEVLTFVRGKISTSAEGS